jgi:hypothetical protein
MGAVAITMDAVRSVADVRITTNRKKPWTSKPWRGGMPTAGVMRKGKVKWRMEYENGHAHIKVKFCLPQ